MTVRFGCEPCDKGTVRDAWKQVGVVILVVVAVTLATVRLCAWLLVGKK
jgi:hypothetical protein